MELKDPFLRFRLVGKPHLTPSELEPDSLGLPAMPLAKRAFFSILFKPLEKIFGTYRPSLSKSKVLAAKQQSRVARWLSQLRAVHT
jgi:hypothetical protein